MERSGSRFVPLTINDPDPEGPGEAQKLANPPDPVPDPQHWYWSKENHSFGCEILVWRHLAFIFFLYAESFSLLCRIYSVKNVRPLRSIRKTLYLVRHFTAGRSLNRLQLSWTRRQEAAAWPLVLVPLRPLPQTILWPRRFSPGCNRDVSPAVRGVDASTWSPRFQLSVLFLEWFGNCFCNVSHFLKYFLFCSIPDP